MKLNNVVFRLERCMKLNNSVFRLAICMKLNNVVIRLPPPPPLPCPRQTGATLKSVFIDFDGLLIYMKLNNAVIRHAICMKLNITTLEFALAEP